MYDNIMYADPGTNHILPQTVDWSEALTQRYMLLLGFKNPEDGTFLEKIINRRSPTFTGTISYLCKYYIKVEQGFF